MEEKSCRGITPMKKYLIEYGLPNGTAYIVCTDGTVLYRSREGHLSRIKRYASLTQALRETRAWAERLKESIR